MGVTRGWLACWGDRLAFSRAAGPGQGPVSPSLFSALSGTKLHLGLLRLKTLLGEGPKVFHPTVESSLRLLSEGGMGRCS